MSEKNEYQWLKDNVLKSPHRCDRVENLLVIGMPDVNACVKGGREFWIEIKSSKEPVRATTPLLGSNHRVSQDQANWFLRQRKAGGIAFFWLGTDKRRMLIPGLYGDQINKMTINELLEAALWAQPKGSPIKPEEILRCFKNQT